MAQSVGRTYTLIGYIFLNRNERYFFIIIALVLFVVCDFTIYIYFTLVKVLSSILSLNGFRGAMTAFSESVALMHDIVSFDMPVSL